MGSVSPPTCNPPGSDRARQGARGDGGPRLHTSTDRHPSGAPRAPDSSGKMNVPENLGFAPRNQLLFKPGLPVVTALPTVESIPREVSRAEAMGKSFEKPCNVRGNFQGLKSDTIVKALRER